jgi:hypothetical protein
MITSRQSIEVEEGDAPEFIESINKIMGLFIFQYAVKEVVLVKIKNWFDHKWLNYSGKSIIPFGTGNLEGVSDVAWQDEWREKVTIPPFNPKRVLSSKFFQKQDTGNIRIQQKIHRFRSCFDNLHNRIEHYTSDGLIVWYSSNSKTNQRGSLMMYRVQDKQVYTWYATIEKNSGWDVTKTKGIELNELKGYIK